MISFPLTRQERRAFVDSSAYLALLDRRDEHHSASIEIAQWLAAAHFRLYTTNTVVIEAHALILSAMGARVATQFLRAFTFDSDFGQYGFVMLTPP